MAEWVPANERQHPPFEPGNTLAMRHGAFTSRIVEPRAAELVAAVLDEPDVAYLAAPSYRPALHAWARAEAQIERLTAWLNGRAPDDEDAASARAQLERAEGRAAAARTRLGLDPLSRARLGRDVASARVDIAQVLADERDRQERQRAALPADHAVDGRAAGVEGDEPGGAR